MLATFWTQQNKQPNNMSNTFQGVVVAITSTKTFNGGFYKCDLVVTDPSDKYPQTIPFECVKELCDKVQGMNLSPGDQVTVAYDLKGREHNGNYYASVKAWKVTPGAAASSSVCDEEVPF